MKVNKPNNIQIHILNNSDENQNDLNEILGNFGKIFTNFGVNNLFNINNDENESNYGSNDNRESNRVATEGNFDKYFTTEDKNYLIKTKKKHIIKYKE